MLHVHNKDTESTIQLLWRNINKIFIYIEKGSISCFLCVVNLFNEARKGYRFSRVYLLRFSKGQFEPCDIHLNNNNIGRRVIIFKIMTMNKLQSIDLVNKMKEITNGEAYSPVHMKRKLTEHFGNDIIITDIQGIPNVVTFRRTATSILQAFYQRQKSDDPESEKLELIATVAKLIKSDIQSKEPSMSYPKVCDLSSREKNVEFIPHSLQLFLRQIVSGKDSDLKGASIGQVIMQSARPRISICPMQIGLGVQLHHHFASKFLIDTLYSFGFCSSYAEVQIFQSSAAVTQGTDILGFTPGRFIQFVADNVDHNIRTLDGLNTFHGMRIIAGLTPASDQSSQVIQATVSTDELVLAGKIDIQYYKVASSANSDIEPLKYKEIKELKVMDNTWKLDLLLNVIWPLRSPMPMWSGLMQMHQKGVYPGKSSFTFFPMIDLDPGDLT